MEFSGFINDTTGNTSTSEFPVPQESCTLPVSSWMLIGLGVVGQLVTILGNILVILALFLVKSLRNPRHYLLLSLAVADLLVGVFVMPFKMLLNINCGIWVAGPGLCKTWLTVDIACCSASVFGLTAVAVDRYIAIFHPLVYKANSTNAKAAIAVIITWILAAISVIPQWVFFELKLGLFVNDKFQAACMMNSQSLWGQVIQAMLLFFIPMGAVLLIYGKIITVITNKSFIIRKTAGKQQINENTEENLGKLETDDESEDLQQKRKAFQDRFSDFLQEYKGCVVVGIIMGVFVVCWLPFHTIVLLNAISDLVGIQFHSPEWLFEALIWLLYANSCANPLIYTMFNKEFRQAFKDIITCRCRSMGSRSRHGRYLQQVGNMSTKTQSSSSGAGSSRPATALV